MENRETYLSYLLQDKQYKYSVLEASTGEEALLLCLSEPPNLIVTDYLLPDMNGLEFLRNLKTQFSKTCPPIIFLTDQGNEQIAVQVMKNGAADYLIKRNTTKMTFVTTVKNVLENTHKAPQQANVELEKQVQEQTTELERANFELLLTLEELQVAQEELRQSNEELAISKQAIELERQHYQDLFKFAPDGYLVTDIWGTIREANLTAASLLSIQQQGLISKPLVVFIANNERDAFRRRLTQLPEMQCQEEGWEVLLMPRTGESFTAMLAVSSIHDEQGQLQGFRWLIRNISIRKQMEQKLQAALYKSETKFQQLAQNIPGAIYQYVLHPDGSDEFTDASPGCRDIYELEPHELLRDVGLVWAMIHPDDVEAVQKANALSMQTLQAFDIEFRLIPPSGCIKWVHARSNPQRQENGDLVFDGLVMDISERKQTQEKVREQAALLDVANDAIFVCNLENRILFWNQSAENLYGWTQQESLGKQAHAILYREPFPKSETGLERTIEDGSWQGELKQITKTGKEIIVASRWTLVRDESGKPKSILVVNSDITQTKQLEQQFYQTQRLESLGVLASGIAHDLNNILTPILAVAQLLQLKLPNLEQKNRQLINILEENSKRGAALVKQITAFARGAEGKRVPLQIRHIFQEIERILKSTFPKSIEISINITTSNLWTISAEPTQIHQVLMNLCVNARDAMPLGGTLTLAAENFQVDKNYAKMNLHAEVGNYVVITVSDTGCGMTQEVKERIFEPFFTTKQVGKGTGLGLSTVIGIIQNHGGFINVHSSFGKGSQFQVFLRAIEAPVTENVDRSQMVLGNGELILVVDDEAFVREIAKASLEESNYRVLIASDAIEAFSLYAQHKNEIRLVLMDIQMPSMDGFQAIRVLQQMNATIKIIVISGLVSNQKLLEANKINVQAFLSKPYTVDELLATIQSVLRA